MSNLCKGKHLKIEDRLIIEYGLDQNYALKEIAIESVKIILSSNVLSLTAIHTFVTDAAKSLRVRQKKVIIRPKLQNQNIKKSLYHQDKDLT